MGLWIFGDVRVGGAHSGPDESGGLSCDRILQQLQGFAHPTFQIVDSYKICTPDLPNC